MGNPTYNETNRAVQPRKDARGCQERVLAPRKTALAFRDGFVDAKTCACKSVCDIDSHELCMVQSSDISAVHFAYVRLAVQVIYRDCQPLCRAPAFLKRKLSEAFAACAHTRTFVNRICRNCVNRSHSDLN